MAENHFAKVHGAGYDPADLLRKKNAELEAQLAAVQQELIMRSAPRVAELMDAVNNLIRVAQQGNPAAKSLLRQFIKTFDNARDATSTIEVVRGS